MNREQTRSRPRLRNDLLFVGGLRKTNAPRQLCNFFEQFGVMTAGEVISDKRGQSKGYEFITFTTYLYNSRVHLNYRLLVVTCMTGQDSVHTHKFDTMGPANQDRQQVQYMIHHSR